MTLTAEDELVEVDPFHLELKADPGSATTWVGVCINPPLRDYLVEHQIEHPQLLVMVRQNGVDVVRYVVPLEYGVVHVTYPRPGNFTVEAAVVWADDAETRPGLIREMLTAKGRYGSFATSTHRETMDDDTYEWTFAPQKYFSGEAGLRSRTVSADRHPFVSKSEVYVDANNFADPPPKWLTAWVRTFFRKEYDQCHFRRHVIATALLTPTYLPFHYLVKFIMALVYSVLGLVYENGFKHILKPGSYGDFSMVFGGIKTRRTAWFFKKTKSASGYVQYEDRSAIWCYSFLAFLVMALAVFIIALTPVSLVASIMWVVGVSLGLAILIGIISAGKFGIEKFMDRDVDQAAIAAREQERKRRREQRRQTRVEELTSNLDGLSCANGQPLGIDALVKRQSHRPTVVFNRVKDGVCKPFAQ